MENKFFIIEKTFFFLILEISIIYGFSKDFLIKCLCYYKEILTKIQNLTKFQNFQIFQIFKSIFLYDEKIFFIQILFYELEFSFTFDLAHYERPWR